VLFGVFAGYLAGLVANEVVFIFETDNTYRPTLSSMRSLPWYGPFVIHLVLMQLVPPNFVAGAIAGLVQWALMSHPHQLDR
jgi:hypothetical protein